MVSKRRKVRICASFQSPFEQDLQRIYISSVVGFDFRALQVLKEIQFYFEYF